MHRLDASTRNTLFGAGARFTICQLVSISDDIDQFSRDDDDFANRVIEKCTSQGVVFGPLLCCIAALTKLYLKALEFADPAENIRERSNFFTTTNNHPITADSSKRQRNAGNDAMRGDDVYIGRFLVSKRKRRRDRRRRE